MPIEDAHELLEMSHLPLAIRDVAVRQMFPELLPSRLLPDLMAMRATWARELIVRGTTTNSRDASPPIRELSRLNDRG